MAVEGKFMDKIEIKIMQKAIEMLRKTTKLNIKFQEHYINHTPQDKDGFVRIIVQNQEANFAVEVKKTLTQTIVGLVIQQLYLGQPDERFLLVTRYVTPQIADQLKEMDVPFIDTAGNAYINEPPLFIFIKGNKLGETLQGEPVYRLFRAAGLRVIFTLLCNPGLLDAPFREIAKAANVALGTVGGTIRELKKLGFFIEIGKHRRFLVKKADLLNKWVETYPEQLRPKLVRGNYEAMRVTHDWWRQADLYNYKAYWGGEVAAAMLTDYLKPEKITIYAKEPIGKFLLKNKIKKDLNGNIEILKTFWGLEYNWYYRDLVHPILIYADLLATGDARNLEVAKIIYEQELTRYIRED